MNDLGIIISNDDFDNECVNQLADAIEKELVVIKEVLNFDKSRFEGKSLVKYYTLDDIER